MAARTRPAAPPAFPSREQVRQALDSPNIVDLHAAGPFLSMPIALIADLARLLTQLSDADAFRDDERRDCMVRMITCKAAVASKHDAIDGLIAFAREHLNGGDS